MNLTRIIVVAIALLPLSIRAFGQAPQEIRIAKGQTSDLWYGINVSGSVHLVVRTRSGANKLTLWWIKWGMGSTQEVGVYGPQGSLEIPITWWRGSVSAKLRGRASEDTIVYVSDRVQIDKSVSFHW